MIVWDKHYIALQSRAVSRLIIHEGAARGSCQLRHTERYIRIVHSRAAKSGVGTSISLTCQQALDELPLGMALGG